MDESSHTAQESLPETLVDVTVSDDDAIVSDDVILSDDVTSSGVALKGHQPQPGSRLLAYLPMLPTADAWSNEDLQVRSILTRCLADSFF